MDRKKKRLPQLSIKPDSKGKYYAGYRDHEGRCQKERFSRELAESQVLYARWVAANFDDDGYLMAQPVYQDSPATERHAAILTSWPHIVDGYLDYQMARRRPAGAKRARGTIAPEGYEEAKYLLKLITKWMAERFKEEDGLRTRPFQDLMVINDYNRMMLSFSHRFSVPQVNKVRIRFWDVVRFARQEPYEQRLNFTKDDVQKFGGKTTTKQRVIPDKATLQTLMRHATDLERLWIWMGLGLGLGQTDLAHCHPADFNKDNYDLRRSKTEKERYGNMPPLIWRLLQDYLKTNPRKPTDLLFVTRNGLPIVRAEIKSEDEIIRGTQCRPPCKRTVKKTDTVTQHWQDLLRNSGVSWKECFYSLRHIGATAFATRPGKSIAEVRTFLGHATSEMSDHYMKPLKPQVEPTIRWINEVLDSKDPMAWEDALDEFDVIQEEMKRRRVRGKGKNKRDDKVA